MSDREEAGSPAEAFAAALAELDAVERGFLLGAMMIAGGLLAERAAGVLSGPSGGRCARAVAALAAMPRAERVRLTGALAREALAPIPAGIADVHADWLGKLFEAESEETARLVAADGPPELAAAATAAAAGAAAAPEPDPAIGGPVAAPDVVAELRRAVLAPIVPVPPPPPGRTPARLGCRLAALSPAALLGELVVSGAEILGDTLQSGEPDASDRTAAELAGPADASPRDTALRAGVRAVGARLAADQEEELVWAIAQRLPLPIGHALLAAAGVI